MLAEELIRLREVTATEEAAICRERGRMRSLEDEVSRSVNERSFFLRMRSPQHEHYRVSRAVKPLDHFVSKALPANFTMRLGLTLFDGETSVEKKDPLFRPRAKTSVARRIDPEVVLKLFEDVNQ